MSDLKPCPKCDSDSISITSSLSMEISTIHCGDCGHSMQRSICEDELEILWNASYAAEAQLRTQPEFAQQDLSAAVPEGWREGDTFDYRNDDGELVWQSGIHVPNHYQAIVCYGKTEAEARAKRDAILAALASSANALSAGDRVDAERWRAFLGSQRIRPLGSAGLERPEPNNYAHMGFEIWTIYGRDYSPELLEKMDSDNEKGRRWLTTYADVARAAIANAYYATQQKQLDSPGDNC